MENNAFLFTLDFSKSSGKLAPQYKNLSYSFRLDIFWMFSYVWHGSFRIELTEHWESFITHMENESILPW